MFTVEESKTMDTKLEIVEGMPNIKTGYGEDSQFFPPTCALGQTRVGRLVTEDLRAARTYHRLFGLSSQQCRT